MIYNVSNIPMLYMTQYIQDGDFMIHRILHTSDWHIGRRLKEHDRSHEFTQFFDWLENLIASENIDTLLVSGDIFDNTTPTVTAQKIYYSFLTALAKSHTCRHTVIISGNHDSPAFLDAPAELLGLSDIHVIGQACENPHDEVLALKDPNGNSELLVCAVPYLRDRDVRRLTLADNPEDSDKMLKAGIREHYSQVFAHAREIQGDSNLPVIAMGHMFLQGGITHQDDGTRELYVGTAIRVDANIFPEWLTYTALGHLHSPQKTGRDNIRYSGSPVAMGFGEAGQNKAVYILELDGKNLTGVQEIRIPVFQRLERIKGDMPEIFGQLQAFAGQHESVWAEVTYTGENSAPDLQENLQAFTKNYPMVEILSVHNEAKRGFIEDTGFTDGLESVTPMKMLDLLFEANTTPQEQQDIYTPLYQEILRGLEVDY